MTGDAYERQQWVMDAYLAGIEDSGRRDMTFIMRTTWATARSPCCLWTATGAASG
jgi:hypothetical protein